MIEEVWTDRVKEYSPSNAIEQELVLTELIHQFVLASLARSGFFKRAEFHGGTCLRIVNGLNRFSEDLDFLLKEANQRFSIGTKGRSMGPM